MWIPCLWIVQASLRAPRDDGWVRHADAEGRPLGVCPVCGSADVQSVIYGLIVVKWEKELLSDPADGSRSYLRPY